MAPISIFHEPAAIGRAYPAHRDSISERVDGGLVADLDLLRRRMARGQRAAVGRAHPRHLARLLGVRRRARVRGHGARPRPALRARQRLGQDHVPEARRLGGRMDRPDARGHEALCPRHHALHPADVLGRAGRTDGAAAATRNSTRFALTLYDAPMRKPDGFSITLSPFRRPTLETAPVDAKAGCLYPNNARAMFEAKSRGFDNCLVCDMLGNVAELANSNVFMAKDGVVFTPMPNGTFLNGITRQRLIKLLRADGVTVVETVLRYRGLRERRRDFRHRQRLQGAADHPHRRARACSPARSTARRASSTGPSRTAAPEGGHAAIRERMIAAYSRAIRPSDPSERRSDRQDTCSSVILSQQGGASMRCARADGRPCPAAGRRRTHAHRVDKFARCRSCAIEDAGSRPVAVHAGRRARPLAGRTNAAAALRVA